jgi:hypothetical protein
LLLHLLLNLAVVLLPLLLLLLLLLLSLVIVVLLWLWLWYIQLQLWLYVTLHHEIISTSTSLFEGLCGQHVCTAGGVLLTTADHT